MKHNQLKLTPSGAVYLTGIVFLGLAHQWLGQALGTWQFLLVGISYLVALRLFGDFIARRMEEKRKR